ncbi:hypothetical protein Zmor_019443, partial [Zophobas morio]
MKNQETKKPSRNRCILLKVFRNAVMTFSITQSSTYSPSPVLRAPPVIKATYLHTEVEHSSVLHRRVPLFDQSSEETAPRTVQE